MSTIGGAAVVVALALHCSLWGAQAQIAIMSPKSLKDKFSSTKGKIDGSTATFGAPFYGDKVLGRLVYGESKGKQYCQDDDYTLPDEVNSQGEIQEDNPDEPIKMIRIALVKRGACSLARKVLVAMNKGAHAVIIVDRDDSNLSSSDLHLRTIVKDDGYGNLIHIPSVLISSTDGANLIAAAKDSTSPVVVELSWTVPADHVVRLDIWMSSASAESMEFMKEFSQKRRVLNEVINFRPRYSVFQIQASDPRVFQGLCTDSTGRFCTEDPDKAGFLTGRDVLEEDVRQLCIHEHTKVVRSVEHPTKGKVEIDYAEKYWLYVEKILDRCPLDGEDESRKFGRPCSESLIHELGLDVELIRQCVDTTSEAKLKYEVLNTAWSPSAVRINGWRYNGMLKADLVTRAICAAFIEPPPACNELLTPRDYFKAYTGQPIVTGVSFTTFVAVLVVTFFVVVLAGMLYKRSLKHSVRIALREEVMLEVEAQMGEYRQLSRP